MGRVFCYLLIALACISLAASKAPQSLLSRSKMVSSTKIVHDEKRVSTYSNYVFGIMNQVRGGASSAASPSAEAGAVGEKSPDAALSGVATDASKGSSARFTRNQKILANIVGFWAVLQVLSILGNALNRLIPIAIKPLLSNDLSPAQWAMYVIWVVYMAYAEGYKAFHLKFVPLVVQRAFGIIRNPSILNYVLAGPYSMGLFGASRKRMIVSWGVTCGVFSLVKIVKYLPYPYRSIVDAGVVVGLSIGSISMVLQALSYAVNNKIDSEESQEKKD